MTVTLTEDELYDAVTEYMEARHPGMCCHTVTLRYGVDEDGFDIYGAKGHLEEEEDDL